MRATIFLFLALSVSLWSSVYAANNDGGLGEQEAIGQDAGQGSGTEIVNTYPHVTDLENAILGQSYVKDALSVRLGRMEVKAFGAVSKDPDLSQRTDALTQYADQKLGKKTVYASDTDSYESGPVGASGTADAGSPSNDRAPVQSDYPHVTALEVAILAGQSFPKDPLADRLSRMETKAFGKPSSNPDLSDRTDALEAYAEKTLHVTPMGQQSQDSDSGGADDSNGAARQGSGRSKALLAAVGSSLLSMAVPGFAGVRMRPRQAVEQPEKPVERQEDPLVHAPMPPPAGTKLITQVGWCEVQIFGHTSANLHLAARLEQLNSELKFDSKKTGFDLMDDVPAIVKIVQARKPPVPTAPEVVAAPAR